MSISEIGFRLDAGFTYTANVGGGRSWTRVTLDMAETDIDQMSATFSANLLTTPVRVFDNSMSWPTVKGLVHTAPWGHISFPFSQPWTYSGQRAMLADYVFGGGVLANNESWRGQDLFRAYLLDGQFSTSGSVNGSSEAFPKSISHCNDSAFTHTTGAYCEFFTFVYSKDYWNSALRGKLGVNFQTLYTAPNKVVLHAFGVAGSATGVDIGALCNVLYIDASKPWVPFFRGASGFAAQATTELLLRYPSKLAGTKVWGQGVWHDSKLPFCGLTNAKSNEIPHVPSLLEKRMTYSPDSKSATGDRPSRFWWSQTLPRLTYR